jgi:hypothetical protein
MNEINTTILRVTSTGQEFRIPGNWDAGQLVQTYGSSIQGLAGMTPVTTVEGDTKRVTFNPQTGTKG